MADKDNKTRKELKQDPLVEQLAPDPADPQATIQLKGWLGKGVKEGSWRLYLTPQLDEYVQFQDKDIVHTQPIAPEQSPLGGTMIWLLAGTSLQHTRVTTRQLQAGFLSGGITANFMAGATPTFAMAARQSHVCRRHGGSQLLRQSAYSGLPAADHELQVDQHSLRNRRLLSHARICLPDYLASRMFAELRRRLSISVKRETFRSTAMLDQSEVATYLLRRGLISEACIVDGDFQVVDASRRNRNFKAISKAGPSYMLKQRVGKSSGDSLAYESGVYQFLGAISGGGASLSDHLPDHYGYDEQRRRADPGTVAGCRQCSRAPCATGPVHGAERCGLGAGTQPLSPSQPPVLADNRCRAAAGPDPVGALSAPSWSGVVSRGEQREPAAHSDYPKHARSYPRQLDELREGWRVDSLIHNDIKWENCLVCESRSERQDSGQDHRLGIRRKGRFVLGRGRDLQ